MLYHMGGCQNSGPFWIPIIIRHLIFKGTPKGIMILTTTHISIRWTELRFFRTDRLCATWAGSHECHFDLKLAS